MSKQVWMFPAWLGWPLGVALNLLIGWVCALFALGLLGIDGRSHTPLLVLGTVAVPAYIHFVHPKLQARRERREREALQRLADRDRIRSLEREIQALRRQGGEAASTSSP